MPSLPAIPLSPNHNQADFVNTLIDSLVTRIGEKLTYIANHWDGLLVFLTDARVGIDSNAIENAIRPVVTNSGEPMRGQFRVSLDSGTPRSAGTKIQFPSERAPGPTG
jgi:hypothetical protein